MGTDRSADQPVKEQATALTQVLSDFKRRGSSLLLAGPAHHGASSAACRRLLGDGPGTRRRLFVLTGGAVADHHGVQSLRGQERETARVVSYPTKMRGASAAEAGTVTGPGEPAGIPTRTVESGLGDLLEAVVEAIEALDDREGGFEPAELRICLDSLDALLATHDEAAVFRFLHLLSAVVRRHRAMCHVHLPTDVDARAVKLVEPTCDAVVEVRDGERPQQRWHVPDAELTTDWLLL